MEYDGSFLKVQTTSFDVNYSGMALFAPAKINLSLGVGPLRDDGYHEIDSVVCKIGMYDRVILADRADRQVYLTSSGLDAGPDEKNIALKAARLLLNMAPGKGADIHLEKNIPPGSGLGGGSSDAATVLSGLNSLWMLAASRDDFFAMAKALGSDVSLFVGGPATRITGRGEVLTPVEISPISFVLYLSPFECSTTDVYEKYDQFPAQEIFRLPEDMLKEPPSEWRDSLVNQLETPAMLLWPELSEDMDTIAQSTGIRPHLTGSGGAIFIPCDDDDEAREVLSSLPDYIRDETVVVKSNPW